MSTVLQLGLHDDFDKLAQTITTACKTIDMAAFELLVWPSLKSLRDLCKHTHSTPENHINSYGPLFQGIIASYITRFVRLEPARPTDWKMSRKGCSNPSCDDCKTLDRFLTHPSQQSERFQTAQHQRKHLSNQIFGETNLGTETDESRSPHTLVVTKTDKRWRDEHGGWRTRCWTATKQMQSLEPGLGALLGGRYEEIAGLGAVKLHSTEKDIKDQGREPLAPVQQQQQQAASNRGKRKAEDGGYGVLGPG
ncbi:MAG: hypothetical protein Q9202_004310 [Teloschistes flavicans]